MKTVSLLKSSSNILLLLFLITSSCSTTRKAAFPCPEPAGNYKSKASLNHPRHKIKSLALSQRSSKRGHSFNATAHRTDKPISILDGLNKPLRNPVSTQSENLSAISKMKYTSNLFAMTDNSVIQVEEDYSNTSTSDIEVADFGNDQIMNERAEMIPINSNSTPGMNFLSYSDRKLSFPTKYNVANTQDGTIAPQKLNWMAIAGFVTGAAGFSIVFFLLRISQSLALFFVGLLLAIGGIVLSRLALRKIRENPAKFRGEKLARAGLVVGIVFLVLWLGFSIVKLFVSQIS